MNNNDIWVFGYGSLVWQPGFVFTDKKIASLRDYQRSFCMWSIHHRGTPENMGLVLALDYQKGARCDGVAFRVSAQDAAQTLAYLRERELVSSAYIEVIREVELQSGECVQAYFYVVDPDHEQYTGVLKLEHQAQVIAHATGNRGPNSEYLINVAQNLKALDLEDPELEWLSNRVQEIRAS
ncbi:gamma-glutamylcyclotransferase [Amylibacter marinus]|nr:gamma-glutamylcyclotransferase [Amylibacter marinus]